MRGGGGAPLPHSSPLCETTSSPATTNSPQIIILWRTVTHPRVTFSPLKHRRDWFLKCRKGELNKHGDHMLICTHMPPLSYTHMCAYTHFYHRCCSSTWSLRNAPTVGDNVVPASILLQSSPSFPPPSQESCHSPHFSILCAGPDTTCQVLQQERLQLECTTVLPTFHLGEVNNDLD